QQQDPSEPRAPLPTHERITQFYNAGGSSEEANANRQTRIEQVAALGAVRTALSIEPRDGVICVFMPPVEKLEEYLEIIAAVELSARKIGCPVHIEGYPPPPDPRLNMIRVTPGPGVIGVNIHAAAHW